MNLSRRAMLAATTAVLAAVATTAALTVPRAAAPAAQAVTTEHEARALIDRYRHDAVAGLRPDIRYAEAVAASGTCPGAGQYTISSRYDLMPPTAAAGAEAIATLRRYWQGLGYQVVNDVPGQASQVLTEDPANGFRVGVSQRAANFLRLVVASPCLALPVAPVQPVLPQELATAREAYESYTAVLLGRLTGDVAALRSAVDRADLPRARAAWRAAHLCWAGAGAAYGSFGEYADAIGGLPQGLPGGVHDPGFTGLHRIEYGLWHGEPRARLLPLVDRLARDVGRLRDDLPQATPAAADLPLRVHEILEDAQRFALSGLTDFGGHAAVAETSAAADATEALLGMYGPLLDERRPELAPAIRAGLDALRRDLRAAGRTRVEAALGGVLEDLAEVPGLLEVTGS